jgi:hypothetical protein
MSELYVRRRIEVNTDPQRRCYDGVHAKSEWRWTDWELVCCYDDVATAESAKSAFEAINPAREYKIKVT